MIKLINTLSSLFRSRRSLPLIVQNEASECGLACLAMISEYHGFVQDLSSLRKKFEVSSSGSTLRQLFDIASKLKLNARAVQAPHEKLSELKTPCILHWDMNHFVVLESYNNKLAVIHDPSSGIIEVSNEELLQRYTGIALELLPSNDFPQGRSQEPLRLRHFWSQIVGLKRSMAQIFGLSILLQLFILASPLFLQLVVDTAVAESDSSLIKPIAFGFFLLLVVNALTAVLRELSILNLSVHLNVQMASNLFRHLIRLPMMYFSKRHIGDVVSRFGSLQQIRNLLSSSFVLALMDGLMAIGTLAVMLFYSIELTIIVIVAVAVYALFQYKVYSPIKRLSYAEIDALAKHDSHFMESIRAVRTIRLAGTESDRQAQWSNLLADCMNKNVRLAHWNAARNTFRELLFGIERLAVIAFAAMLVIDQHVTLGMLFAFLAFRERFVGCVISVIDRLVEMRMLDVHLNRLSDITSTDLDPLTTVDNHTKTKKFKGHIKVRNLSFSFGTNEPPIFSNLNFEILPGESVAICGSSGCGKTTLLNCLLGLYQPTSGEIEIDDIPLFQHPDYRKFIGSVLQDDQLLSGSILENISNFDPSPDMERIVSAAKTTCIHQDIENMVMQYETLVGDMGSTLSGGQKQRILLARAIYRNPTILFMDEATSNLDVQNESLVNSNIRSLSMTRVFVAHRPSMVDIADRQIHLI